MKRRDEDQLIHLAFGELAADEAARVEAALTPDSVQLLDGYRSLKNDLKLLNAAPAASIGTERLREAILRQGLKRKAPLARWGLVLAPCLSALLVLAFFSAQSNNGSSTTVVTESGGFDPTMFLPAMRQPALHPETEITNASEAVREDVAFPQAESPKPVTQAFVVSAPKRIRRVHLSPTVDPRLLALDVSHDSSPTEQTSQEPDPSAPPVSATPFAADDPSLATPDGRDIIVVHDAQDRVTGAQQATEVDPTTNVVVGG